VEPVSNPLFQPGPSGIGAIPGPAEKMGLAKWETGPTDFGKAALGAGAFDLNWSTPTFDLRPEFAATDPNPTPAVQINRSAALGTGVYLRILILGQPAFFGDTRWYLQQQGNDHLATPLYLLSQEVDVTTAVRSGGFTTGAVIGASALACEPPASGVRFWRVLLRGRQTGGGSNIYSVSASVF